MSKGLFFWLVYIVIVIIGLFFCYRTPATRPFGWIAIAVFVLVGIIGWAVFGAPVH